MEMLNNYGKCIGDISKELEKGMMFWGVIAEILEKYDINKRIKIKDVCNWFKFENNLRSYLYKRCKV